MSASSSSSTVASSLEEAAETAATSSAHRPFLSHHLERAGQSQSTPFRSPASTDLSHFRDQQEETGNHSAAENADGGEDDLYLNYYRQNDAFLLGSSSSSRSSSSSSSKSTPKPPSEHEHSTDACAPPCEAGATAAAAEAAVEHTSDDDAAATESPPDSFGSGRVDKTATGPTDHHHHTSGARTPSLAGSSRWETPALNQAEVDSPTHTAVPPPGDSHDSLAASDRAHARSSSSGVFPPAFASVFPTPLPRQTASPEASVKDNVAAANRNTVAAPFLSSQEHGMPTASPTASQPPPSVNEASMDTPLQTDTSHLSGSPLSSAIVSCRRSRSNSSDGSYESYTASSASASSHLATSLYNEGTLLSDTSSVTRRSEATHTAGVPSICTSPFARTLPYTSFSNSTQPPDSPRSPTNTATTGLGHAARSAATAQHPQLLKPLAKTKSQPSLGLLPPPRQRLQQRMRKRIDGFEEKTASGGVVPSTKAVSASAAAVSDSEGRTAGAASAPPSLLGSQKATDGYAPQEKSTAAAAVPVKGTEMQMPHHRYHQDEEDDNSSSGDAVAPEFAPSPGSSPTSRTASSASSTSFSSSRARSSSSERSTSPAWQQHQAAPPSFYQASLYFDAPYPVHAADALSPLSSSRLRRNRRERASRSPSYSMDRGGSHRRYRGGHGCEESGSDGDRSTPCRRHSRRHRRRRRRTRTFTADPAHHRRADGASHHDLHPRVIPTTLSERLRAQAKEDWDLHLRDARSGARGKDPDSAASGASPVNYNFLLNQLLKEDEERNQAGQREQPQGSRRPKSNSGRNGGAISSSVQLVPDGNMHDAANPTTAANLEHHQVAHLTREESVPSPVGKKKKSTRESLRLRFEDIVSPHTGPADCDSPLLTPLLPTSPHHHGGGRSHHVAEGPTTRASSCPRCLNRARGASSPPASSGSPHHESHRSAQHHHSRHLSQQQVPLPASKGKASMRYVVGVLPLLFRPNALEEEEQDSRVWARGYNTLRRQPSVWDRWRRRSAGAHHEQQQQQQQQRRHSPSAAVNVDASPAGEEVHHTDRRSSRTAAAPVMAEPRPNGAGASPLRPVLPVADATPLTPEQEAAKQRARRVGALKVSVLLLDALVPFSVVIGAPLFLSAVAMSGLVMVLPGLGVMLVPVYWTVVKLHNACFSWNTWKRGEVVRPAAAAADTRTTLSVASPHARRRVGSDAGHGSNDTGRPESGPADAEMLSGGWLLTAQSVLDLADRLGGRPLLSLVILLHTGMLLTGAVLMLSTGVMLTGGSANTLSFLKRHAATAVLLDEEETSSSSSAGAAGHLVSGGCQLYPREHLLPLILPFTFLLMFTGPTTPLRWGRRLAYWDTAFFKLMTTGVALVFCVVLVAMQIRWRLYTLKANARNGTDARRHFLGGWGYPFLVTPADVVRHGAAPSLGWMRSFDDGEHWLWRFFTTSFLPANADGERDPQATRSRFARAFFSTLDFTALHLSLSVSVVTWLLAFAVFTVKAGGFHFFLVPLFWRGRQASHVAEAVDAPVTPSEHPRDATAHSAFHTAEAPAEGDISARRACAMLTRGAHWVRGFCRTRRALWERRLGAYGASGFGASFTIAMGTLGLVVAALAVAMFVATPLSSVSVAAPLHLRLLWTAVEVEVPARPANSTGHSPHPFAKGVALSDKHWGDVLREEATERRVVCDLGIQAGLPTCLLVCSALLSMLLGIVCYAWVPFFLAHASSSIAYAPRNRLAHTRSPQRLQEASLSAFMRSKWAVAIREVPGEVESYLASGSGGTSAGVAWQQQQQQSDDRTNSRGPDRRFLRERTSTSQEYQPQRQRPMRRLHPLISVMPEQLFRLHGAFMVSPERHRATTRTGVPIRIDRLYQYLRLSTRDVYYFNDRYYFYHQSSSAETAAAEGSREGRGPGGRAPSHYLEYCWGKLFSQCRPRSRQTEAHTDEAERLPSFLMEDHARRQAETAHEGEGEEEEEEEEVSHGLMRCRRLFVALLVPSTFFAKDGFAMRAWALVTEFTLLRLPFLLVCFILAALVVAGPTARCHRFWSLVSVLRAWGHYDGSPNRLRRAAAASSSAVSSLAFVPSWSSSSTDASRTSTSTFSSRSTGRSTTAPLTRFGEPDSDWFCGEPILTDVDSVIASRVILASASTGGLVVAPLVFGLPLFLLIRRSLQGKREQKRFWKRLTRTLVRGEGAFHTERDDAARVDQVAGGLAGVQFFLHVQKDTRRSCTVTFHHRRIYPLSRFAASDGAALGDDGTSARARNGSLPFNQQSTVRVDVSEEGERGIDPEARSDSQQQQQQRHSGLPSFRASGAALWEKMKCSLARLGRRFHRFFVRHAHAQPPLSGGFLPFSGNVTCGCWHARTGEEEDQDDGRAFHLCGLCLARHRRWWGLQRRASRTAQADPRLPPLSSAFYVKHLYEAFVRRWHRARQHQQQQQEQDHEQAPRGRETNATEGVREEAAGDDAGVRVPLLAHSDSHDPAPLSLLPAMTWNGHRDVLGSLVNAALVAMLCVAWVLATFGAVRAISLLY